MCAPLTRTLAFVQARRSLGISLLLGIPLAWAAPAGAVATFSGIGDLSGGATVSQIFWLSGDGSTAVGRSESAQGFEATRWTTGGGLQSLGSLTPSPDGFATGASNDGSVIAGLAASPLGGTEAFRWTEATGMVGLGDLPGGAVNTRPFGMSGDGTTIVGDGDGGSGQQALRWTSATGFVPLGDLPGGGAPSTARGSSTDGSVIAGWGESANGTEAFRWTEATGMVGLGDLPGGAFLSNAWGISADGEYVVGSGTPGGATREAFRWSALEGMIPLGDLPGGDVNSTGFAVSADGSVVGGGGSTTSNNLGDRAILWIEDVDLFDVQNLLTSHYGLDLSGWRLVGIRGVSNDGLVWSGNGVNPDGFQEGWIASVTELPAVIVPEPGTATLLGVALLSLLLRDRGR